MDSETEKKLSQAARWAQIIRTVVIVVPIVFTQIVSRLFPTLQTLGMPVQPIVTVVAILMAASGVGYVRFSRVPSRVLTSAPKAMTLRYPRFRRTGNALILFLLVTPFAYWGADGLWRRLRPRDRFVVAVADLCGPEPQRHQVTADLIDELRVALKPFHRTYVQPLGIAVTEQEGSEHARKLGHARGASVVVWGRYEARDSGVGRMTIHFEIGAEVTEGNASLSQRYTASPAQSGTFELQDRASRETTALVLFLSAFLPMARGDFGGSETRLTTAIGLGAWPEVAGSRAELHAARGVARDLQGDWIGAYDDFSVALKALPDSPELLSNRGLAQLKLHRLQQAVADLNRAVALRPDPSILVARGLALSEAGHVQEAIGDYSEAIRRDPGRALGYINRAGAYVRQGRAADAVGDASKAIELEPRNQMAYVNRGTAYRALGRDDKAMADYASALRIDARDPLAHSGRARVFLDRGAVEEALQELRSAIDGAPRWAMRWYDRACVLQALGRHAAALSDYNMTVHLDKEFADAYNNRGNVYSALGRYDEAFWDYSRCIELNPVDVFSYRGRALVSERRGRHDDALRDLSLAIAIEPTFGLGYFDRARVYEGRGDFVGAIADYTCAIELKEELFRAYLGRARAEVAVGRHEAALRDFSEAITVNPGGAEAFFRRGLLHYVQKRYAAAVDDLTVALRLDPGNTEVYAWRKTAQLQGGMKQEALKDLVGGMIRSGLLKEPPEGSGRGRRE